jgi:integral membrane protein (TIGR01906 family)
MHISDRAAGLARALLFITVPLILLLSPLYLFVTNAFVRYEYRQKGFPPSVRFDDLERLRLSATIIGYLRGRNSLQDMAAMRTAGEVAMRAEEVGHIADVKRVMDGFYVAHGVALLLALSSALVLWFSVRRGTLGPALRRGIWITCGIIALIVGASLIDFETFFTHFHQLFFSADSWLFYEEDTLIQLYPLTLWMDAVWKIGVVVICELVLFYVLTHFIDRWARLRRGARSS